MHISFKLHTLFFEVLRPNQQLWSCGDGCSSYHFFWASLTKPLTSTLCTYFRLYWQPFLNQQNGRRSFSWSISIKALGRDRTQDPKICSGISYRLHYRSGLSYEYRVPRSAGFCWIQLIRIYTVFHAHYESVLTLLSHRNDLFFLGVRYCKYGPRSICVDPSLASHDICCLLSLICFS